MNVVVVVVVVVVSSAMGLSSNPAHVSNRKRMKAHRKKNIFLHQYFFSSLRPRQKEQKRILGTCKKQNLKILRIIKIHDGVDGVVVVVVVAALDAVGVVDACAVDIVVAVFVAVAVVDAVALKVFGGVLDVVLLHMVFLSRCQCCCCS